VQQNEPDQPLLRPTTIGSVFGQTWPYGSSCGFEHRSVGTLEPTAQQGPEDTIAAVVDR
jgi:hypothetical protein